MQLCSVKPESSNTPQSLLHELVNKQYAHIAQYIMAAIEFYIWLFISPHNTMLYSCVCVNLVLTSTKVYSYESFQRLCWQNEYDNILWQFVELHNANSHTCKLVNLQTCILAYLPTCLLAYLHTCTLAYMHTYILAYLHTCIHAHLHTCILAYLLTCKLS